MKISARLLLARSGQNIDLASELVGSTIHLAKSEPAESLALSLDEEAEKGDEL